MPLMFRPPLLPDFVGQRTQAGRMAVANIAKLFPRSQRHGRTPAILIPVGGGERTMRAYITVTGIAVGLLTIWAALVPLVA